MADSLLGEKHKIDKQHAAGGLSAFLKAVVEGDVERVKALVESGENVDQRDWNQETALMKAAADGNLTIVRYLVEAGADVNAVDRKGNTPLIHATLKEDNFDVVQYLIESGADVNTSTRNRSSPLMCTSELNVIQLLFEWGADVNASNLSGETPLMRAAKKGNVDIVRLFVSVGANINSIDNSKRTSLLHAVENNHLDIVQFLTDIGADINLVEENGWTPLMLAARKNIVEAVQFLVCRGANIHAVDKEGSTVLFQATKNANIGIIRLLIKYGAEVNVVDRSGETCLMIASKNGDLDVVRVLVESGADVTVKNFRKWTSIMLAARNEKVAVVHFLVDSGADLDDLKNNEILMSAEMENLESVSETSITQLPVNCFISAFDVKLVEFIGLEHVGGNYRALWLDAEVAVQLFVPEASATPFAHEVAAWHQLRHLNVLKLYGACDIGHNFFVWEWASNGLLLEYLAACENRGEQKTPWKFLHQAALGLAYLHERNIVHGNLCANSILVGTDGLAKLTNFQVSYPTDLRSDVNYRSLRWKAPEQLKGEATSLATDIYSFCLCVMAVVTEETPWDYGLHDAWKQNKEKWDPIDSPHYCDPVNMTEDLTKLALKMCGKKSNSRESVTVVVRLLENLAMQESKEHQQSQLIPDAVESVSEFNGGELLRLWQKLQDIASTTAIDPPHFAVFREVKTLFERLSEEPQKVSLLQQFCRVIVCVGAIDVGSRQVRIFPLSSTKARERSITAIFRRIDEIWAVINDFDSTEEYLQRREMLRLKHQEVFISESSQKLFILSELKTVEAREAFVIFLKSEIDSHGSLYSETRLNVLEKAYFDLKQKFQSDAVITMPEWFLPWYELQLDRTNCFGECGFSVVYRAKYLGSDVLVKENKCPGLIKWDSLSESNDSLSDKSILDTKKIGENECDTGMFQRKVDIWFGFNHPHVVRLYGACHVGTPNFVCEYASNGSLDTYLHEHPGKIWQQLYEAALGVQYLHSRGIVHGNLKCKKIVVGGDNKAKIADIGLIVDNVVSGAWQWVAPECLEGGSSELSLSSDTYALGMCIVEALRIVEITTENNKGDSTLPWGNLHNYAVKYHVTHKKLPSRPQLCTDHEWELVKRMCAYDRSERIKISTVVDKLAALAGAVTPKYPELTEAESIKPSKELFEKMQQCCSLEVQDERLVFSKNQVKLRSVYGLLWDRLQDLWVMPTTDYGSFELIARAHASTLKMTQSPDTLVAFTDMAMNGYACHRELDKIIDANFWHVDRISEGLHDWRSKCITFISAPEFVSLNEGSTKITAAESEEKIDEPSLITKADAVCPECGWNVVGTDVFCRLCGYFMPTDAVFA